MMQLYLTLKKVVEDRQVTGRVEDDAMQELLDRGDGMYRVVHVSISLSSIRTA